MRRVMPGMRMPPSLGHRDLHFGRRGKPLTWRAGQSSDRAAWQRIGLDIGGTFTDFVLLSTATSGDLALQVPDHAAGPFGRGARGPGRADRAGRHRARPTWPRSSTARRWSPTRSSSGAARGSACSPRRASATVLEMGTEQRYDIYDLFLGFPDPLVPRRHRLEIGERIDRDGRVVAPLDPDEVRAAVRRLVDDGHRGGRGLLPAFLRQSGARAGGARADRARIPRPVRVALLRRGRGAARISARGHDLRQRLRAAADGPLSGELRARAVARAAFAARCG